jgi:cell division protein FtsB
MSDDKLIKELATRNSRTAVDLANKTREELTTKLLTLEKTVAQLVNQVSNLQQKYNLLLSNRFNKGSTTEE